MTRDEIDGLILFASHISRMVHEIETNLYSTSEDVDESAISLRAYAMHKLIDNISDATRYLDEEWIAADVETQNTPRKKSKVA